MHTDIPEVQQFNLNGQQISIRPITPDDKQIEAEFIKNLSAETKHYRFFCGVNTLSEDKIRAFCRVDGQDSMAFVATVDKQGKETEIGVSRYTKGEQNGAHEMAVTIADNWQDTGLDRILTQHLVEYARLHGISFLYAVELSDNSHMSHLANELGMSRKADPDDVHQIIYTLALD